MQRGLAVAIASLFLVALFALTYDTPGGSLGRRLASANSRTAEDRHLSSSGCDVAGDYMINNAAEAGVQITQTGSQFALRYISADVTFSGSVTGECAGVIDFGAPQGEQAFTFDANTGKLTFTDLSGTYFVRDQVSRDDGAGSPPSPPMPPMSSTSIAYTHEGEGKICTDDWNYAWTQGTTQADEAACAAHVAGMQGQPHAGFVTYVGTDPKNCIPCKGESTADVTVTPGYGAAFNLYFLVATPAPTFAPVSPTPSSPTPPSPTPTSPTPPSPTPTSPTPSSPTPPSPTPTSPTPPSPTPPAPTPATIQPTPRPTQTPTQQPTLRPTQRPTSRPTPRPSPAPTPPPQVIRTVIMQGDYDQVVGSEKTLFLTECSASPSVSPSVCRDVYAGSIVIEFQGIATDLDRTLNVITTAGITLPSFGTMQAGNDQPTPSPTYSVEYEAYRAPFKQGCQLNLNFDECQMYSLEIAMPFETTNSDSVPRGCSHQNVDDYIVYNSYADWFPVNFDNFCQNYELDGTCVVQSICRKEDWTTTDGFPVCAPGHELTEAECQNIGTFNNVYGAGYATITDANSPRGCFGNADHQVLYNDYSEGVYDSVNAQEGEVAFCQLVPPTPSPTPGFNFPTPQPTALMTASPTPPPPAVITDYLYIKNAHGICLDAKSRRIRGGTVHMWSCQQKVCMDEDPSFCAKLKPDDAACADMAMKCQRTCGVCTDQNRNQHWDFSHEAGADFGTIKSHDGICLDASNDRNGGKVWMWPCKANNKRQKWKFIEATQQIQSMNGFCLDARQRMTVGGLVHLWTCQKGNKNQEWNRLIGTPTHTYYSPKLDYTKNILETGSWDGPYLVDHPTTTTHAPMVDHCPEMAGMYTDGSMYDITVTVTGNQHTILFPTFDARISGTQEHQSEGHCEGHTDFGEGGGGKVHFLYSVDARSLAFDNGVTYFKVQ